MAQAVWTQPAPEAASPSCPAIAVSFGGQPEVSGREENGENCRQRACTGQPTRDRDAVRAACTVRAIVNRLSILLARAPVVPQLALAGAQEPENLYSLKASRICANACSSDSALISNSHSRRLRLRAAMRTSQWSLTPLRPLGPSIENDRFA
jgi:hypothetical protein